MKRLVLALATTLAAATLAPAAEAVTVTLEGGPVSTSIGRSFTFATTVENTGGSAASGLVAHLNVLSDDPGLYVDPEDWSSHRTQYLAAIAPNARLRLTWTVQAVNSGDLTLFVSVLPRHGAGDVATSAPLRVTVAKRRTLNAGGVLPLTLGVPAAIALFGLGVRWRRAG